MQTAIAKLGAGGTALPALTLALSAALWGTTWYPFRLLAEGGIDGLWAIVLTELAAVALCAAIFRGALRGLRWWSALLPIGLLGGVCNTGYVMGAIHGEVLRVTLLLYLAPLWTVFLAHWLLHEQLDRTGLTVVALSLAGALVMLWPFSATAQPLGWPDLWGLIAGLTYAGYNVLVRRHLELSVAHKTLAAALGSAIVAALWLGLWAGLSGGATLAAPSATQGWLLLGTGVMLVGIVVLMQFGLERMPASRAIVILMLELVFAALTAWWLADEVPGWRDVAGGLLIVAASVVSARSAS